jgi:CheY-like chemotaxis protein
MERDVARPAVTPSHREGPVPAPARAARLAAVLRPRLIVLACSDPQLGDALERVIRHHGAELAPTGVEVRRALDGVATLQQMELQRPDLLLVHARLDRMAPDEVVAAWERAHPDERVPLLVLSTAYGSDVPRALGAQPVVGIPCDNAQLVESVARALPAD